MNGQTGQAPGVVKVRLSGEHGDVEDLAEVLTASPAVEVLDRSAPYPNRRDPGVRVYLTLRISEPEESPLARRDAYIGTWSGIDISRRHQ